METSRLNFFYTWRRNADFVKVVRRQIYVKIAIVRPRAQAITRAGAAQIHSHSSLRAEGQLSPQNIWQTALYMEYLKIVRKNSSKFSSTSKNLYQYDFWFLNNLYKFRINYVDV